MIAFAELSKGETAAEISSRVGVKLTQHTVLGFDVYKYSSMETIAQRLVPMVLHPIRLAAISQAFKNNHFTFQRYKSHDEIHQRFIDTGDGGLYILENPIEAITILIYHAVAFQGYNFGRLVPQARSITPELELRYAITMGDCYKYRGNFYGSSIINATRTLAKDHLNRILIDKGVHDWFGKNFFGVTNLPNIGPKELTQGPEFSGYDKSLKNADLFGDHPEAGKIFSISEMKLHDTAVKATALELYAVAIQFELLEEPGSRIRTRLGIGNLNTTGLD